MVTQKEVKRVAKLARIGLTKKEEEKFSRELSLILNYVEKLKEVNISKTLPTSHSIKMENVMREDLENEKLKMKNGKLLKLAPETKSGYLKVKSIFK